MIEGKDYLINRYTGERWEMFYNRESSVRRKIYRNSKGNFLILFPDSENDVKYAKEVFGFDLK